MDRATVIYLITETATSHGVYSVPQKAEHIRYAVRKSASRTESYQAMSVGFKPSCIFKLSAYSEYDDQKMLKDESGKLYKVIRSYETSDGGIELTVERQED